MHFNFITLFPELVEPYFAASILNIAKENGKISFSCINPRDKSTHKHKKVDDYMLGGGAGLVLHPQPLFDTLEPLRDTHIVFLTPVGKKFIQSDARRLAKKRSITFVCGRYEGIDERVIERYANEVFSIGDFVMTGGELGALCMADAISRNISGVINPASLDEESFENHLLEAPAFAKPLDYEHRFGANANNLQNFRGILTFIKGNHARIAALKNQLSLCKTKFHRPDLLAAHQHLRKNYEK